MFIFLKKNYVIKHMSNNSLSLILIHIFLFEESWVHYSTTPNVEVMQFS
jgi:hypothetical protein